MIDTPPAVDETLAWVLREMVTNVVRHSGASTCQIDAIHADGCFVLEVRDDGLGGSGEVVRRAHAGEQIVDPALALSALREGEDPLTPRERDVLRAARDHATVADLAEPPLSLRRHRPELPLVGHAQARRPYPSRGHRHRRAEGLALDTRATLTTD